MRSHNKCSFYTPPTGQVDIQDLGKSLYKSNLKKNEDSTTIQVQEAAGEIIEEKREGKARRGIFLIPLTAGSDSTVKNL